jgi:hypothetical protein
MFDKDAIEGPVLLLFAANVEEATKVLTSNPDKVFRICRGLLKVFVPGNIPANAAMAHLANLRTSEVAFPFQRTSYILDQESAAKRARVDETHSAPGRVRQLKQQQVNFIDN